MNTTIPTHEALALLGLEDEVKVLKTDLPETMGLGEFLVFLLESGFISSEGSEKLLELNTALVIQYFTPNDALAGKEAHELQTAKIRAGQLRPELDALNSQLDAQKSELSRIRRQKKYPAKDADMIRMQSVIRDLEEKISPVENELLPLEQSIAGEKQIPTYFKGLAEFLGFTIKL